MEQKEQENHQSKKRGSKYNRFFVANVPFYLFLGLLAVVYIANSHFADKMLRETGRTEKAIREMQFEYKTVKKDVMFRGKESELVKVMEPLGLKALKTPPIYIADTLKKKK